MISKLLIIINYWHALFLKCNDYLYEFLAIQMCAQGMYWNILDALQVNKSKTFQELATPAHDMELASAYDETRFNNDKSVVYLGNTSSILRDHEDSEYSYSEVDAPKMFDKHLEKGLTELPQSKHPEEIERSNDLKHYKYYRIISHPLEKRKSFK